MRKPRPPRRASPPRRGLALALLAASAVLGAAAACGPDSTYIWVCLNPVTGKEDNAPYDASHYVDGMLDPCHCYDPCGPAKSCPILVDAGSPCDAGVDGP